MADQGFASFTLMDYDSEKTNTRLPTVAITAANFAAQETLKDALRDAIAQITLGTLVKTVYANEDKLSITPATDTEAQRELKWLVSYHDTTTLERFTCEIGTADTDELDPNDRAHAHIGDGALVDGFVTAFQAAVKTNGANAVLIDEITLVGRLL